MQECSAVESTSELLMNQLSSATQPTAANKPGLDDIHQTTLRLFGADVGLGWGELRVVDQRSASMNCSLAPYHHLEVCFDSS